MKKCLHIILRSTKMIFPALFKQTPIPNTAGTIYHRFLLIQAQLRRNTFFIPLCTVKFVNYGKRNVSLRKVNQACII